MKFLKIILIFFISLITTVKADSEINIIENLKAGGKLIFIRHAYAPGGGDPDNFDINDCLTQRNLSDEGKDQSKKIGKFFENNNISIDLVISSEWCRCKETAKIAFKDYTTKNFLNSFFSLKFQKNKKSQIKNLNNYLKRWNNDKNLILVTHYVVILEMLNYAPSSGEIVVSDKNLNLIGTLKIEY